MCKLGVQCKSAIQFIKRRRMRFKTIEVLFFVLNDANRCVNYLWKGCAF